MSKIGFYGGSFNPPTKAHIELAKKVIKECSLDKVIFVPVGDLYEKEGMAKAIHPNDFITLIHSYLNDIENNQESREHK